MYKSKKSAYSLSAILSPESLNRLNRYIVTKKTLGKSFVLLKAY